ncbi:Gfo/Idh/MocA family protein [Mycobacterium sp.]|uniref:Gfo/Idh/MocA family protein n=1 Tax=Mycobacterium sp. TaxID=1785 RepID=UPI003F9A2B84
MDQHRIRVGVIGAGWVAQSWHLPVLAAMPQVELSWICDIDRHRAEKIARAFSVRETRQNAADCPDVDVVLVAIPLGFREPVLATVFSRKWHAFIEKPFAATCAEHDGILQAAASAGVEVGVAFLRRFYAGTVLARQLIARSMLGPIEQIWATDGQQMRSTTLAGDMSWRADRRAAGGGLLIEAGCHIVDQVLTLSGAVNFELGHCELTYYEDVEYEFKTAGTLELDGGRRCRFGLAASWLGELYNAIVVEFTAARLRVSISAEDAGAWLEDREGNPICYLDQVPGSEGVSKGGFQAVYAEWCAFIEQCRSRVPSRASAASGRLTTQFIEECYRRQPPPRGALDPQAGRS